jgi:hypothetical protein
MDTCVTVVFQFEYVNPSEPDSVSHDAITTKKQKELFTNFTQQ